MQINGDNGSNIKFISGNKDSLKEFAKTITEDDFKKKFPLGTDPKVIEAFIKEI